MMVRTQIALDSEVHRRARERASDLGISLAEYVRRLVDRELVEPRGRAGVTGLFDLGDSGGSDIARDEDHYIGEAVEAELLRDRGRR